VNTYTKFIAKNRSSSEGDAALQRENLGPSPWYKSVSLKLTVRLSTVCNQCSILLVETGVSSAAGRGVILNKK